MSVSGERNMSPREDPMEETAAGEEMSSLRPPHESIRSSISTSGTCSAPHRAGTDRGKTDTDGAVVTSSSWCR